MNYILSSPNKFRFGIRSAMIAILFGLSSVCSLAQTYTIGTGTLNSSTGITPFHCLYEDNRNQYLYLASELTAAGATAGSINSIQLNITTVGSPIPKNVEIKMGATAATALGTSFAAGPTTVYSASSINITATGWYTFTLSTPFIWNGTSNIIVEFCRDHADGDWSANYGVQSTQFGTGVFRSYTIYDDGISPCTATTAANVASNAMRRTRPNMRFTIGALPTCFAPTSPSSNTVTATSANFSWTAPGTPPSSGYNWEIRTSGAAGSGPAGLVTSGSTAAGVTTTSYGSLTQNTTYSFYVRGFCGGSDYSTWTSAHVFTTPCLAQALPVLEGLNSNAPGCWNKVVVTNTDIDFTGTAPQLNYVTSSLYPTGLVATEGSGFFSFNSFDCDTGDQIRLVSAPLNSTGIVSVDVMFDWSVDDEYTNLDRVQLQYSLNGTTWVNVGSAVNRFSSTATTPTWTPQTFTLPGATANNASFYVGFLFTGDYGNDCHIDNIRIQASPSCVQPTAITAGTLTTSTAPFSWTASVTPPSSGYEWELRTSGAGGSGAIGLAASGSVAAGVLNATATGLTFGETYTIYVRSNCGAGDFSIWSSPVTITLPCPVLNLPISEGFNEAPLTCWTSVIQTDGNGDFTDTAPGLFIGNASVNPTGITPDEGSNFLIFNSYDCDSGDQIRLISPAFSTVGIPSVDVSFSWILDNGFSASNDRVRIFYSFTGTAPWTAGAPALARYSAAATTPTWTDYVATLPVAVANQPTVYIGLLFTSGYGNDCHLDNLVIQETPTCFPPTALTAGQGGNSVAISWTAPSFLPLDGYEWEVRTSGAAGSGNTGLAASGATVAGDVNDIASGLALNTTYSLYVRGNCGVDDESIWAGPLSFTTLAFNPAVNDEPAGAPLIPSSGNAYPACSPINGNAAIALNSSLSSSAGPDLWYRFIAQSTAVRITLQSASMDNAIQLFDNSLVALVGGTEDLNAAAGGVERLNFVGLTPGQQYYVSVGASSGAGSTFSLCVQHLLQSQCDDPSGTYDLCTNFKADYAGANSYLFQFTPTSFVGPTVSASSPNQVSLASASLGLRHGETYNVVVNSVYNLTDGLGNPETITATGGPTCTITIAPHADLRTKDTQRCPSTLLKGSTLQAKPFVCAAINHTIEFQEVTDCSGLIPVGPTFTTTTSGTSSSKSLAQVGGVQAGKWYVVRWRPNFAYGPGSYGTADIIQIAGTASEATAGAEEGITPSASVYPNPNDGRMINVNITDIDSDIVSVRVLDNTGRLVHQEQWSVDGSLNAIITFQNELSAGLYHMEMTMGAKVLREKLVIEK